MTAPDVVVVGENEFTGGVLQPAHRLAALLGPRIGGEGPHLDVR